MEEQQLYFDNLPTEALFSFFCTLDPSLLGTYSTVCKKWAQMCRDNELWRQYCIERWDKNPKESDCAKNWLIPVREGGGSKENRIDWRRCYLLRSFHDKGAKFFQLVPEKKQRLGFLKRKNNKKLQANGNDLFAKGWPVIDDLARFEKKVQTAITKIELEEDTEPHDMPDYVALMDLFLELELLILRQINISRIKFLGCAGRFLEYVAPLLRNFPNYVPSRLASFAAQFSKLAAEKDIPTEVSLRLMEQVALIYIDLISNVILPTDFTASLTHFISVIISIIARILQDSIKQWANEDCNERPVSVSPTQEFEAILHSLSLALENKQDLGMQLFLVATQMVLDQSGVQNTSSVILPVAVLAAVARGFAGHIGSNSKKFMENHILPFWKPSTDAEYLVPALYYFSQLLSEVGETSIQTNYVAEIIQPLLTVAKHENHNVQREVADFVIGYCSNLLNKEVLVPYLNDLLDIMYGYCGSKNVSVRKEAVIAISSLIITCQTVFAKHKDRIMTEFKKLLANGDASDRKSVIEALSRIGAGIGDQKSSIEADIEVLYDQVVEDCKRDRDAYIDLLLKMTEFGIVALGPKFAKHIPFVFPLLIENARLQEIERRDTEEEEQQSQAADLMDVEEGDDDEDAETPPDVHISGQAIGRKDSALASLLQIINTFDRAAFLAVHEEICAALQYTLAHQLQNTAKTLRFAREIFTEYIRKLFTKGDPEWCKSDRMWVYWLNSANMFIEYMEDSNSVQLNVQCVFSINQQPFLTEQLMEHFTEVVFSSLCGQYYQAEEERIPFEEIYDLGSEIIDLMESMCIANKDKESFWKFGDAVLGEIPMVFEVNGIDQYRWFDVCLICTVFDHFGYEFAEGDRITLLNLVVECRGIQTKEMYQCLANHIGVMARKFPELLPKQTNNIDHLCNYVVHLLIGDNCQREAAPGAYDNALMALSCLVFHTAALYERSTDATHRAILRERLVTHMTNLTSALPPAAVDGDKIEADICIDYYCQTLAKTQVYFEGEDGAALKNDVIRALKESMEMPDYNHPDTHKIVDPLLKLLQA